jgi:hypothetical protein
VAAETFGWSQLRDEQLQAMEQVMPGHDVLAALPTGSGKSAWGHGFRPDYLRLRDHWMICGRRWRRLCELTPPLLTTRCARSTWRRFTPPPGTGLSCAVELPIQASSPMKSCEVVGFENIGKS